MSQEQINHLNEVGGGDYYDMDAMPIGLGRWAELFGSPERFLRRTRVGEYEVSTIWLGLNHNFGGGRPLIFESMVFAGPGNWLDQYCDRYPTKADALTGHENIVGMIAVVGDVKEPRPILELAGPPFSDD